MRQNFNIAIRDSKRVETIITSNRSLNIKICRCVIAAPRDAKSQNMSLVIFCCKLHKSSFLMFRHFHSFSMSCADSGSGSHAKCMQASAVQDGWCGMVACTQAWRHSKGEKAVPLQFIQACIKKQCGVQKSTWRRLCQWILCALVCKVHKLGHIILRHKNSM